MLGVFCDWMLKAVLGGVLGAWHEQESTSRIEEEDEIELEESKTSSGKFL